MWSLTDTKTPAFATLYAATETFPNPFQILICLDKYYMFPGWAMSKQTGWLWEGKAPGINDTHVCLVNENLDPGLGIAIIQSPCNPKPFVHHDLIMSTDQ